MAHNVSKLSIMNACTCHTLWTSVWVQCEAEAH